MLAKDFHFEQFGYFLEDKQKLLKKLMNNEYRGPVLTQRVCGDTFGVASQTREKSLADQLDCMNIKMQLHSDVAFGYLEPWCGVGVYANAFGAPLFRYAHCDVQTKSRYHDVEEVANVPMPKAGDCELMRDVLGVGGEHKQYDSWDGIFSAFMERLRQHVDGNFAGVRDSMLLRDEDGNWQWKRYGGPAHVVSLFEDGCIENGRGYYHGGCRYVVRAPHIGGAPDAGNSLYAIRKAVYEDHLVTLPELLDILEADWEGQETLRQTMMNRYVYYGNDNPEADAVTAAVLDGFAEMVLAHAAETPIRYVPGVSTFGRQIDWLGQRTASPFGMKKNTILAGNCSPTPGTDLEGATAIIKSYCRADLQKQVNGAALDIKLHPTAVQGENGLAALEALLTGFVELGGYFMQVDVIDAEVLKEARKNPEAYKTLSVRVSGWNARFVTLTSTWQDMIIERTATGL